VQEVALSQGFLLIFRFPIAAAIPSIVPGLTIFPLEATAPKLHCLNPARKEKSFRGRKILSLIVAYCEFQLVLRFLVMTDAKVPSNFMKTRTLVNLSWISVSILI